MVDSVTEYAVWHIRQLPKALQNEAGRLLANRMRDAYAAAVPFGRLIHKYAHFMAGLHDGPENLRPRMVMTERRGGVEKVIAVVDYNPLKSTVNEIASTRKSEDEKARIQTDLGKSAAEELVLHLAAYLKNVHDKKFVDVALAGGERLAERSTQFGFSLKDMGRGVHRVFFPKKTPQPTAKTKWTGRHENATLRR